MAYTKSNESVMDEGGGSDAPASGSDDQYQQQTVSIPISACPTPPKPGAMLQFKVVSVDQNAGMVNAVCVDDGGDDGGDGGSDSLAAEFNQQK